MTFMHAQEHRKLPIDPQSIVFVASSFNQISLAVPGHSAEPAQAFVVGHKTQRGQFNVYVYILLTQTNTPVVYVRSGPPVAPAEYPSIQADAHGFCESMGFLLDDLGMQSSTPERRQTLLESFVFLKENPMAGIAVQDHMLEEVAAEELRPADLLVNLEAMSTEQKLAWARFLASF
jgi:hypothetical protein